MLTILLLLCALVWAVLLFHQIAYRGLTVLLIWLLIAPVASNVVFGIGRNPFFQTPSQHETRQERMKLRKRSARTGEVASADAVKLSKLLDPTRTLLLAFFLVFLLDALAKRRPIGPFNNTEFWMGAFFLILLTSVFLKSYQLHFSMRIVIDAFLVPFLTYFTARRLVTQESHFRQLVQIVGYLSVYLIGIAFIERLMHSYPFYRLGGPFRQEGILYLVLTVGFLVTLLDAFASRSEPETQPVLPWGIRWIVLGLSPIIVLLTWERGNWAGFLMGVWGFFLLGYRLFHFSRKLIILGLMLILLPMLVVSIQVFTPQEVVDRRAGDSKTIYGRLLTWQITIEEGLQNPVFGVGFDNMRYILGTRTLTYENVRSYVSVHNSYLALFAELGLVGLVTYLAILVSIIRMGWQLYRQGLRPQDQWRGVAVIALMLAYLIPSLFASKLHMAKPLNTVLIYSFLGGIAGLYGRFRDDRSYAVTTVPVSADQPQLASEGLKMELEPVKPSRNILGRHS